MTDIQTISSSNDLYDDTTTRSIGKREACKDKYCTLEHLIPKHKRILKHGHKFPDEPVYKAHRKRVEDICRDCDHDCDLKKIAMTYLEERYLVQGGCVEIFKLDRGKKLGKEISWDEALMQWTQMDAGDGKSYAKRFAEVWEVVNDSATEKEIYEFVVASPEVYKDYFHLKARLAAEKLHRHVNGI